MSNATSTPKFNDMEYRVVGPLGNGGGSTILQIADRTRGGKRFALKVVKRQDSDDDIYIAQAQAEYEAAWKLNHPSIARIYDCRIKRSMLFKVTSVELLMEFVDGKTLDEIETPTLSQLVLIFNQVAAALVHMHRRGVYHGDLKPSNIMVTKDGKVKLIDFGTAWLKGQEKNRIQGTPQYMAPEQVTEKVVDERTDIYNFGATMYRMFTGRYANPGSAPRTGDNLKNKLATPIQLNPNIPGTLNETILACLQTSPRSPTRRDVRGSEPALGRRQVSRSRRGVSEARRGGMSDRQGPTGFHRAVRSVRNGNRIPTFTPARHPRGTSMRRTVPLSRGRFPDFWPSPPQAGLTSRAGSTSRGLTPGSRRSRGGLPSVRSRSTPRTRRPSRPTPVPA